MYLDEIVEAQKRGEAKGITSICSTHPWVLKTAMQRTSGKLLIEATCNQVNQFGGYTGMTPLGFVEYVCKTAEENQFPFENIILGGDHLGPNVWQNESANSAMQKAEVIVRDYVQAGFVKIHLDCSMNLGDDPKSALKVEVAAQRTAQLARIAEEFGNDNLRYVIGTEVPLPGGAHTREETVSVTKIEDVEQTIHATREAFLRAGIQSAWERVIAIVVQPGVEFGDEFILPYKPDEAKGLLQFIEDQPMVYEAHSTDYQTRAALKNMVQDHFAILKVGPGLTFAFREAIFALAMIENELIAKSRRSNIVQVLDDVMERHPEYWEKYYQGDKAKQAFKRKYSLSDRVRYYWVQPEVQHAIEHLLINLGKKALPYSLLSQFVGSVNLNADQVIQWKINRVLNDYWMACNAN
jgi:D-tagatose-1,6-bisphosphate aldolase subunit GatZ/KbaZ